MLNNKLNPHGGFTPAAMAPPNAIIPGRVLHHHRFLNAGAVRGNRHGPRIQHTHAFYFLTFIREIPQSQKQTYS
jgi:hypothetical protein